MMNWTGFGRKCLWPNVMLLFRQSPGETEGTQSKSSQDRLYSGRDLNPGLLEYVAGFGRKLLWPNFMLLFRQSLGETEKTQSKPQPG
jgi:hypothetical protein